MTSQEMHEADGARVRPAQRRRRLIGLFALTTLGLLALPIDPSLVVSLPGHPSSSRAPASLSGSRPQSDSTARPGDMSGHVLPTASPFPYRGVIEGFYGPPWSPRATIDTLEWMGRHGFNIFVYAPKDDPFQRANWRDPYPPTDLVALRAEVVAAHRAGIDWVPNLSPGLPLIPGPPATGRVPSRDICFSCSRDREVLEAKLQPFFDMGVRTFMVSFDDVVMVSTNPEDVAAYGTGPAAYGAMVRDLLNAVYRHFAAEASRESFHLLTVLPTYSGTSDTADLQAIRSNGGLAPGIHVLWTGTATVSKTIDPVAARTYATRVGRDKVIVWDNYPANDYTGGIVGLATRLFLGPYRGRSPDLFDGALGVLANPMDQPLASRLPLATVAAYLADPRSYQPDVAWGLAIEDLAGNPETAAALRALADNSRSSTLDTVESPTFVSLRQRFLAAYDAGPFWVDARNALLANLTSACGAREVLWTRWRDLAREDAPWLDSLASGGAAALLATKTLAAARPALSATVRVVSAGMIEVHGVARPPSPVEVALSWTAAEAAWQQSLLRPQVTYGDRVETDLSTVYVADNEVDRYMLSVAGRLSTWAPRAPRAASGVHLVVDGRSVPVGPDGRFSTAIPRPPSGVVEVIAIDASGSATGWRQAVR